MSVHFEGNKEVHRVTGGAESRLFINSIKSDSHVSVAAMQHVLYVLGPCDGELSTLCLLGFHTSEQSCLFYFYC